MELYSLLHFLYFAMVIEQDVVLFAELETFGLQVDDFVLHGFHIAHSLLKNAQLNLRLSGLFIALIMLFQLVLHGLDHEILLLDGEVELFLEVIELECLHLQCSFYFTHGLKVFLLQGDVTCCHLSQLLVLLL